MKNKIHMRQPIIFLIMTLLSGCEQDKIEQSSDQEIFFEVSYINHAWGDQFKGFVINKEGQIKTYDKPVKWNEAYEQQELTLSQIQANIAQTALSSVSVPAADLKNFASKINLITGSEFTKPVSGGADRGSTRFYAYRYDQEKQIYTPVLLSQTGDVETHHTDPSAIQISTWLTGILSRVY